MNRASEICGTVLSVPTSVYQESQRKKRDKGLGKIFEEMTEKNFVFGEKH